jgi:hypothetical protein
MTTASDLLDLSRRELMDLLREGHAIDPGDLDDTEYKGVSLGLPAFVERLTWKTFKKVFHRDPATGHLRGWNVRLEQNGLHAPCVPRRGRDGRPVTFGHYRVVAAKGRPMPEPCDRGLLIDYGLGGNAPWGGTSRLRDPLVAVSRGSAEVLLGWSYIDLGAVQLGTPSFFSLERDIPLSHRADPPRRSPA